MKFKVLAIAAMFAMSMMGDFVSPAPVVAAGTVAKKDENGDYVPCVCNCVWILGKQWCICICG